MDIFLIYYKYHFTFSHYDVSKLTDPIFGNGVMQGIFFQKSCKEIKQLNRDESFKEKTIKEGHKSSASNFYTNQLLSVQ